MWNKVLDPDMMFAWLAVKGAGTLREEWAGLVEGLQSHSATSSQTMVLLVEWPDGNKLAVVPGEDFGGNYSLAYYRLKPGEQH